jgi:hypothetical protein
MHVDPEHAIGAGGHDLGRGSAWKRIEHALLQRAGDAAATTRAASQSGV